MDGESVSSLPRYRLLKMRDEQYLYKRQTGHGWTGFFEMKCKVCKAEAVVALSSHNAAFCGNCYQDFFRRQVVKGICSHTLLSGQERILVAVSGGKDSLVLLLELYELGYDVTGLYIDLGIHEASVQARKHVARFCKLHGIPLLVHELAQEGLPIPRVKEKIRRPVCSVCGKIKRYYFNKVALEGGFDVLATGHNLDDETSRLMSNTLRWDADYLASQGPNLPGREGFVRKIKPLWRLTEFETANYAFLRGIDYHCAACPFSPGASFTTLKDWLQKLERTMPGRKLDFYQGFLTRGRDYFARGHRDTPMTFCASCGLPASGASLCSICRIKELVGKI